MGLDDVDDGTARARIRDQFADADPTDLVLLHDLLGIKDPAVALPDVAADARRRRLTALINSASLERGEPAVYVVEDAHWIDEASESMLADFLAVIPQSRAVSLITYRPEYRGALTRVSGAQRIALRPLRDEHLAALSAELLGSDASVGQLATTIAERAAGNPFFAQEMVRDLSERGTLRGQPGNYELRSDIEDVEVPATLQAAIGARIDRLGSTAKRTLQAAAVIGARFDMDLLTAVSDATDVTPLIEAELVDQVRFSPSAEFAFRHPMFRSVAYESQLKSDRAQLHQRLAKIIEQRNGSSADENAALIAQHYDAAGDLHAAFSWYMRAGGWFNLRDNAAATQSWRRALAVADRLTENDPERRSMRIAPLSLLCATAYRAMPTGHTGFDELRDHCVAMGDRRSLAIGMMGQLMEKFFKGHRREAGQLATELVDLLEQIADPTLTVALMATPITAMHDAGGLTEALRWAERVIELADSDVTKGRLVMGSPLALGMALRSVLRYCLGITGWQEDRLRAREMAISSELITRTAAIYYAYAVPILDGVVLPDEFLDRESAEILAVAEQVAEDVTLGVARCNRGLMLLEREGADRDQGREILSLVREAALQQRYPMIAVAMVDGAMAREAVRVGDYVRAIHLSRAALDDLYANDGTIWIPFVTAAAVEALCRRGEARDAEEARFVTDRLAALPTEPGYVLKEIWLLRCRALLAKADGDLAYEQYRDRYRSRAEKLGFEGHNAMAQAMP
jgi:adenylate cyclase